MTSSDELSRLDYLTGRYLASRHTGYQKIDMEFSDASPHYLLIEARDAFEKMARSAKKDGVALRIVSGFRSFARQKVIWENKYLGHTLVNQQNLAEIFPNDPLKKVLYILKFSAAPGTSRHHWGTDLDINSVAASYFKKDEGRRVFKWLVKNAGNFGFCQVYTPQRKTGYQEEMWHWSYVPISRILLQEYQQSVPIEQINGFLGYDHLPENFYQDYIFGINHVCIRS